jgi:hypothetical protein
MKRYLQAIPFFVVLILGLFVTFAPAEIKQAIIPAVVPTANRQGSTGNTFFICNAGPFTSGDLVSTDANGNCADSGAQAPTASGTAGQILSSQGASMPPHFIDFADTKEIPAAACNNATAATAWNLPSSSAATPTCLTQSNTNQGVLTFAQSTSAQPVVLHIPKDWDTSAAIYVSIDFDQGNYTTASSTIIMSVASGCSSTPTSNPAFQTAQNFGTATTTTTAYQQFTETVTLNSTSLTSCTAPGLIFLKISRGSGDTAAVTPDVFDVFVTVPRLPAIQAN